MLYEMRPSLFTITSGLHQNSAEDTLHISCYIQMPNTKLNIPLHINGWLNAKGMFCPTTITHQIGNEIELVCDFRELKD
jgi:hypothetical protein